MAPRMRTRSIVLRTAALSGVVLALRNLGAGTAYTVKGSWEGSPSSLKKLVSGDFTSLIKALEPQVALPAAPGHTYGKWKIATTGGRVGVDYENELDDAQVRLHIDDDKSWKANITNGEYKYAMSGAGLDLGELAWEATRSSNVPAVGDLNLKFNSNNKYELSVSREKLAEIAGINVGASGIADSNGMAGRFMATGRMPGDGDFKLSVSNPYGNYKLGDTTQEMEASVPAGSGKAGIKVARTGSNVDVHGSYNTEIAGGKVNVDVVRTGSALSYGASVWDLPLAGGQAGVRVTGKGSKQNFYTSFVKDLQGGLLSIQGQTKDGAVGYNATFSRDLSDVLQSDSKAVVGVDDASVYGSMAASRTVADGIAAEYLASGRVDLKGENKTKRFGHSLKLSHKLGYAQLVQGTGDDAKLRLGYEFDA